MQLDLSQRNREENSNMYWTPKRHGELGPRPAVSGLSAEWLVGFRSEGARGTIAYEQQKQGKSGGDVSDEQHRALDWYMKHTVALKSTTRPSASHCEMRMRRARESLPEPNATSDVALPQSTLVEQTALSTVRFFARPYVEACRWHEHVDQ